MGILDDLRYAVRSLVRRPSLTLFAVATLALGIGSTTAIFSTVESVMLNPLPFENGDRMVGIWKRLGNADGARCVLHVNYRAVVAGLDLDSRVRRGSRGTAD